MKNVDTILEVGCGTGSSIFPLLSLNKSVHVYGCDFAKSAIDLVLKHPGYASGRVDAFVADITQDKLIGHMPEESTQACLMIFVLSAISPARMLPALLNINSVLNVGGTVCFRDYCYGDLAQKRLDTKGRARKIEENFFARGDGTRAYFFTEEMLTMMFKQAGFDLVSVEVITKFETNRKLKVSRDRKYIQAIFKKTESIDNMTLEYALLPAVDSDKTREIRTVDQIHCSLGMPMQIGTINVFTGLIRHVLEDALVQFILQHPYMIIGNITIDLATQTKSAAISFAALNYSNRHITVSSPRTDNLLRYIFQKNAERFVWERLRVFEAKTCDEDIISDILQLQYETRTVILLPAIPESRSEIESSIELAAKIARLESESSQIIVSCLKCDVAYMYDLAQYNSLKPGVLWDMGSFQHHQVEPSESFSIIFFSLK